MLDRELCRHLAAAIGTDKPDFNPLENDEDCCALLSYIGRDPARWKRFDTKLHSMAWYALRQKADASLDGLTTNQWISRYKILASRGTLVRCAAHSLGIQKFIHQLG